MNAFDIFVVACIPPLAITFYFLGRRHERLYWFRRFTSYSTDFLIRNSSSGSIKIQGD